MGTLYVVRHGQASFLADDYDNLSAAGHDQGRVLGRYFVDAGLLFDQVFLGPRRRHRQTLDRVREAYAEAALPFPEPVELADLDEHAGQTLLDKTLLPRIQNDPDLRARLGEIPDPKASPREFWQFFQMISRLWVRGELAAPELEPWSVFRERVESAVSRIAAGSPAGARVAVFTSGGPSGVIAGYALGLNDEKTLELSWTVRNGAFSEFRFSGGRFSLSSFNVVAHANLAELVTYV